MVGGKNRGHVKLTRAPAPPRTKYNFRMLDTDPPRLVIMAEISNVEEAASLIDLIVANANAGFEGEVLLVATEVETEDPAAAEPGGVVLGSQSSRG